MKSFKLHPLQPAGNLLIVTGNLYLGFGFWPVSKLELGFWLSRQSHPLSTPATINSEDPLFANLNERPANTNSSIMIPKIKVNAPIIANVSVTDTNSYFKALESGVAHAENTPLPSGDAVNTYLFAHSTPNPLNIQKYAAVFTLLHHLAPGDLIIIFSHGQRFNYRVQSNKVTDSFDLTPLLRTVTQPTLTLQTCDPPGIPINRRIVPAELVKIVRPRNMLDDRDSPSAEVDEPNETRYN